MFIVDKPINLFEEDKLGRSDFARFLGESIINYKDKDSITIGLYGEWGSGKSSIIELALNHIQKTFENKPPQETPIIFKFNPWNFSDQNQLIAQFFNQLSLTLGRIDYSSEFQEAGKKLHTIAKIVKPFSLIPVLNIPATLAEQAFDSIGSAFSNLGESSNTDFNQTKDEINNLLLKQKNKIIIVIDDIDRLNDNEVRQVFQVIKSLADFPNTVYLLSFDKQVIINALNKTQNALGLQYLEKIIQISFDIPLVDKVTIDKLLFGELDNILEKIDEYEKRFDKSYWGDLFYGGFRDLFKNIRDIKRYINTLNIIFNEKIKQEVNIIDFWILTGIQVFIPDLYNFIKQNPEILCNSGHYKDKSAFDTFKNQYEGLLETITNDNPRYKEKLKKLILILFPELESLYRNISYGNDFKSSWRREGRICSIDNFKKFFIYYIPTDEISLTQMQAIISSTNNQQSFSEILLKLNEENRSEEFFKRFNDYIDQISIENIPNVINALIELGDIFPEGGEDFLSISIQERIIFIIRDLLEKVESTQKRFEILVEAIDSSEKSLYIANRSVYMFKKLEKLDRAENANSQKLLKSLAKKVIYKTQIWADNDISNNSQQDWAFQGKLINHRNFNSMIYVWQEYGSKRKLSNYISKIIKTDNGLSQIIIHSLSKTKVLGGEDKWKIYKGLLEKILNIKRIKTRLNKIYLADGFNNCNSGQQLAIKAFIDQIGKKSS